MPESPAACSGCAAVLTAGDLNCPACHRLVYAGELKVLAERGRAAETRGDRDTAIDAWNKALELLPAASSQAQRIRDHVVSLSAAAFDSAPPPSTLPRWIKRLGPLGVAILLLFKFKTFGLLLLTKAKFLILGLGKLKTLLSMFVTMGVYWSWYGWQFAAGFILGIYVHEMGHVWALKRLGLRASAPMFIPGFGAFVSLYDSPADVRQDAEIGLAGPLWGAGAAIACVLFQSLSPSLVWIAIARATAFVNLFNLTPIWQLDGGRAFRALDRRQRMHLGALMLLLWFVTGEGLFFILLLGAAYRIFWQKDYATAPAVRPFLQFAGLLLLFGALLALLPVRR